MNVLSLNKEKGGAGRSHAVANKIWKILDPKDAEKNCFYKALVLCKEYNDNPNLIDNKKKLNKMAKYKKDYMKEVMEKMKKSIGYYAGTAELRLAASIQKCQIKVYDNIYNLVAVYDPPADKNPENRKRKCRRKTLPTIELMLSNNHYVGLVRWRDIGETPPEEQRPESKDLIAECKKIKKSGEFCSPAKPRTPSSAAMTWNARVTAALSTESTDATQQASRGWMTKVSSNMSLLEQRIMFCNSTIPGLYRR